MRNPNKVFAYQSKTRPQNWWVTNETESVSFGPYQSEDIARKCAEQVQVRFTQMQDLHERR